VPWFPVRIPGLGGYARWTKVAEREERFGIMVDHPRYLMVPGVGMLPQPFAMARSLLAHVRRHCASGAGFDLIDAHYFYPDGVAAVRLARALNKPVVITARGTDLNLFPEAFPLVRRLIVRAAEEADALITVCAALKDVLVGLGLPAEKVTVLRNGVDLEQFTPLPRAPLRAALGLDGPTLVSVGLLIERKGHHLVIEAMADLPGHTLLVAGEGPERGALERLAARLGVADRVRFLGGVPHDRLAEIYAAADLLVLASSREGWANVLLEAMACGTPVVATAIWGTPEVVDQPAAGRLMPERSAKAIVSAVTSLLADPPDRAATRRHAERFSWGPTTAGQIDLFRRVLAERRAALGEGAACPVAP
jgi:glycosyltransferase involved in cell wall biosynthesis